MIEELKNNISKYVNDKILEVYNLQVTLQAETPKNPEMGDIAIPSFPLSKVLHKNPQEAGEIVIKILNELPYFSKTEVVSGFVNAHYSRVELSREILSNLDLFKDTKNKGTICIDYSSPNIAKPFSIGHLRSTMIGQSLGNILSYAGYKVVRIDHLGDFGTQFGKLIYAYKTWGKKEDVEKNPINTLVSLYVKFNQEAEKDPTLDNKAREIFAELENGNEEYQRLWQTFRNYSIKEFERMYALLSVKFDEYSSEAGASRRSSNVINKLIEDHLLIKDQGAMIVPLPEPYPPAIILKTDGSSLYITRDLEEIYDRFDKYHFDRILYVVGNEQKLYFNQLKAVLHLMKAPFADSLYHVNFGLILKDGKKMSTRTGTAVKLDDVINESIRLAKVHIDEKNSSLENKDEIARKIGVSAIVFNDLKNYRENDYEFNLEEATRFEGQTGPYLEYTSVRIGSIISQAGLDEAKVSYELFNQDSFFEIVKKLDEFDSVINRVIAEYAPNYLAKYLLSLSASFNSFYVKERVLVDDPIERNTKLFLIKKIKDTLDLGMKLLGMQIVGRM